MFLPDYPGAIVVEAANYGYPTKTSRNNRPKTWGFHTPEEPADAYPSTPDYLAGTHRNASYTYFDSYLGFIFQLVPESEGAYAHGLEGKPEPDWSDGTNLNLQSFSLSFEGYTNTIHQTLLRGSPQWNAGVNLVAHRTKALGLNLDIAFQHKEVSDQRGDCGQWDQAAFIADVKAKLEEDDDMLTDEQHKMLQRMNHFVVKIVPEWEKKLVHLHAHGRSNRDRIITLHTKIDALRKEVAAIGSGGGGGATPKEVFEAAKKALREGGG